MVETPLRRIDVPAGLSRTALNPYAPPDAVCGGHVFSTYNAALDELDVVCTKCGHQAHKVVNQRTAQAVISLHRSHGCCPSCATPRTVSMKMNGPVLMDGCDCAEQGTDALVEAVERRSKARREQAWPWD